MRRLIKLITVIGVCLFTTDAFAQWSLVPEIGMTAVKRVGQEYPGVSWLPSYSIGVNLNYQIMNTDWEISSGVIYYKRKYSVTTLTLKQPNYDMFCHILDKQSVNNINIPFLVRRYFTLGQKQKLSFAIGPYIGSCICRKNEIVETLIPEYGSGQYMDMNIEHHKFDPYFEWGFTTRLGLEIHQWVFNLGYDLSLGKENDHSEIGARYHTLSLNLGYKFYL